MLSDTDYLYRYKSYEASIPKSAKGKTAGGAGEDHRLPLGAVDARAEVKTPGASSESELLTGQWNRLNTTTHLLNR